MRTIIEGLIKKVVKAIDKLGTEEEKKLAHEMVDKVLPTPTHYENIFYVKGNETFFKVSNKETYSTTCKEKKQDNYVGCAIVYGYHRFGSKTKFNKHLKEFYGCSPKEIEKYAIIDAYTQFGGKEEFEKFVNERFRPKKATE